MSNLELTTGYMLSLRLMHGLMTYIELSVRPGDLREAKGWLIWFWSSRNKIEKIKESVVILRIFWDFTRKEEGVEVMCSERNGTACCWEWFSTKCCYEWFSKRKKCFESLLYESCVVFMFNV